MSMKRKSVGVTSVVMWAWIGGGGMFGLRRVFGVFFGFLCGVFDGGVCFV